MNLFKIAAVVAAASAAVHANAVTETFDSTPVFTYTGGGTLESKSIAWYTKKPDGSTGKWLSVGKGATETVSFGAAYEVISFIWGSVDDFNIVTFYNGATEVASLTGTEVASLYGVSDDGVSTIDFTYTSSTPITSLTLTSTIHNAFEVDNITAAAVPEPETYALMLAGLGAMAFLARRRQS